MYENEKDILNDASSVEKHLIEMCSRCVSDVFSQSLRSSLVTVISETQQVQLELLNAARSRGWLGGIRYASAESVKETAASLAELRETYRG